MLTIAGVAAAGAILNAVFPLVSRSASAIVHAVGELDSGGSFDDTNGNALFDIFVWVKNVGDTRNLTVSDTDLFLGPKGNFTRIPHDTEVEAGIYPRWNSSIENDTEWGPKATIKITVTYSSTQAQANYDSKVVIPNGVSDEYFFSL